MYKKLSIVIPIYNEFENVMKIISQLDRIENKNFEVIFVDGYKESDSKVLKDIICPNYRYERSDSGRGIQMNTGFKMIKHDLVLFLHCDSIIDKNMINDIIRAANKGVKFGCQSLYFNDKKLIMRVCAMMSRFRAKKRKIAFGDQGMFFVRNAFENLGYYREIPIMEDYDISMRAKNKYQLVQIDTPIITSSRKFYRGKGIFNKFPLTNIGILMIMWDMQVFQRMYRRGDNPCNIFKKYYMD